MESKKFVYNILWIVKYFSLYWALYLIGSHLWKVKLLTRLLFKSVVALNFSKNNSWELNWSSLLKNVFIIWLKKLQFSLNLKSEVKWAIKTFWLYLWYLWHTFLTMLQRVWTIVYTIYSTMKAPTKIENVLQRWDFLLNKGPFPVKKKETGGY